MAQSGLLEVKNPSEIFLSERVKQTSGSVVVAVLEGSRPILVEIQALVSKASFGFAKRRTQGIDYNRVSLLVAVLEKRLKMDLSDKDIFVNVAGGVKVEDPAADLAVVIAIASALKDRVVPADTVLIGEVGLAAEVRSVSQINARINEAQKLGFKRCIVPKNNLKNKKIFEDSKIEIAPVYSAGEALELL